MAKAKVGPTGYGSWGILWEDFPYMERRGGYSGPFKTLEDAERKALEIMAFYEEPVQKIERVATLHP